MFVIWALLNATWGEEPNNMSFNKITYLGSIISFFVVTIVGVSLSWTSDTTKLVLFWSTSRCSVILFSEEKGI